MRDPNDCRLGHDTAQLPHPHRVGSCASRDLRASVCTVPVIKELSHPKSPEAVRTWASSPPEWLTVQDPRQTDPSLKLGIGEAAAISLALELRADQVLIDERKGYKAALQRGLKATTTLGVFEEAAHRGLIDFAKIAERLDKETTFCVTADVLEEFRRRVREQKHAQE